MPEQQVVEPGSVQPQQGAVQPVVQQNAGGASPAADGGGGGQDVVAIPLSQLSPELRALARDPYNMVALMKSGQRMKGSLWERLADEADKDGLSPYEVGELIDSYRQAQNAPPEPEQPPVTTLHDPYPQQAAQRPQQAPGQAAAPRPHFQSEEAMEQWLDRRFSEVEQRAIEKFQAQQAKAKEQAEKEAGRQAYIQAMQAKEDAAYDAALKRIGLTPNPRTVQWGGQDEEFDPDYEARRAQLEKRAMRLYRSRLDPKDPEYKKKASNPDWLPEDIVFEAAELLRPIWGTAEQAAVATATDQATTIPPLSVPVGPGGRPQTNFDDLSMPDQMNALEAEFKAKHGRGLGQEE